MKMIDLKTGKKLVINGKTKLHTMSLCVCTLGLLNSTGVFAEEDLNKKLESIDMSGTSVDSITHENAMRGIARMDSLESFYGDHADQVRMVYYRVMTDPDNIFLSTNFVVHTGSQTIIFSGEDNDIAKIFGQAQLDQETAD